MKKIFSIISANILLFPFLASPVFAEEIPLDPCGQTTGSVGSNQIKTALCDLNKKGAGGLIANLVVGALIIATVIALFFLVYGGIRWILSGGDKAKVEEARKTIIAAVVGLIITFLAYFILQLVLGLFGLTLNQLTLPTLTK